MNIYLKLKDFQPLSHEKSQFTDDTVAIADALLESIAPELHWALLLVV